MKQLYCISFTVDKLTKDRICCAISAEALGFAALRALSDISAILLSSPVKREDNFKEKKMNKERFNYHGFHY